MDHKSHLFAYGTLMCSDIIQNVAGYLPAHEPGILYGYSRHPVKGEAYPAIVPNPHGSLDGIVYQELTQSAWKRLDLFEGELYVRKNVEICLQNGSLLPAVTYVIKSQYRHYLEPAEWNFERFLRKGKQRFKEQYRGYEAL